MDLNIVLLFFCNFLLTYKVQPITADDVTTNGNANSVLLESSNTDEGQAGISTLENGISDVKSIIMEKYGRHYRLTGGSTLATKRNKPDVVNIDATAVDNSTASVTPMKNATLNETVTPANTTSVRTTDVNNTAGNDVNKNSTAGYDASLTANSTAAGNTTGIGKTDLMTMNDQNKTVSSKSDIANVTNADGVAKDKTEPLENTKNSTDKNANTFVFGSPEEKPKWFAEGENNYTTEGNLTTINIDLTKGATTTAAIPGLDLSASPLQTVDIVYGNSSNAPKRSGSSIMKPKNNIVFEINKPRMAINDFANKRKQVPHGEKGSSSRMKKRKNISHTKKRKNISHTKKSKH